MGRVRAVVVAVKIERRAEMIERRRIGEALLAFWHIFLGVLN